MAGRALTRSRTSGLPLAFPRVLLQASVLVGRMLPLTHVR